MTFQSLESYLYCAFVLSSGSGMACGAGTKMSRRLDAICVANESLRSVGVFMV